MHYKQYVNAVEQCIDSVLGPIADSLRSWQEDHLSYSICDALQARLKKVEIEGLGDYAAVGWDAFKQRGSSEQHHGDIAVLVRYVARKLKEPLSGVGFLEAKMAYPLSGTYDAIDWPQLERICKATQYSMLLLYNHEKVRGYGDNVAFQQFSADEETIRYADLSSYACVLQTLTAIHIRERFPYHLHAHAVPLSHQLCNRYLRFMDLDTARAAVSDAQGWTEEGGRGGARYLLVATVIEGTMGQPPPLKINSDVYEPLNSDKPSGPNRGSGGGAPPAPQPKPKGSPAAEDVGLVRTSAQAVADV